MAVGRTKSGAVLIDGLDDVVRNLNTEIKKIQKRSLAGLLKAGLYVRGEAQKLCPVDTGNLKNSAYIIHSKGGDTGGGRFKGKEASKLSSAHRSKLSRKASGPWVEIGFSAFYAVYVHEINKNYNVGQYKFLESALRNNTHKILEIIRKEAQIK